MSTPPPIPPKGSSLNDASGHAAGNNDASKGASEPPRLPRSPEPVEEINIVNDTENVYEPPQPPKSNKNWLWIIPSVLLLLAVAGGIYFYYSARREQELERREAQEAKDAEEARRQAMQDSIASAQREQARQDSILYSASGPDLDLLDLHGPVRSVMFKINYQGEGYETDGFNSFFSDVSIEFDRGGNIVSWGSLNNGSSPSLTRDASGAITRMDFSNLDMTVDCRWSGSHLIAMTFNSPATNELTFKQFNGDSPTSILEHYTYSGDSSEMISNVDYTLGYSDRDEYGNWLKADVRGHGSRKNTYLEYDAYYEMHQPRTETETISTHYTITRYISYYDKEEFLQ